MIIEVITNAFSDVTLGDGIGIFEAEALDGYLSQNKKEIERKKDIRDDWRKIPDNIIENHGFVLTFMDPDGLKFAIPAYMIFALRNYKTSSSFCIDSTIYALDRTDQWVHLNLVQQNAVAKFIQIVIEIGNDYFDTDAAMEAYEKKWKNCL
jgi:hypothetical protein